MPSKKPHALLTLALCLAQAGCVPLLEGITPREVDRSVPEQFGTAPPSLESAAALPFERLFQDPDLVALIEQALAHNQELDILQMEIVIANAEALARTGEYQPKVAVGGGAGLERVGRWTSQERAMPRTRSHRAASFPKTSPTTDSDSSPRGRSTSGVACAMRPRPRCCGPRPPSRDATT